jgi:hypothetical protein
MCTIFRVICFSLFNIGYYEGEDVEETSEAPTYEEEDVTQSSPEPTKTTPKADPEMVLPKSVNIMATSGARNPSFGLKPRLPALSNNARLPTSRQNSGEADVSRTTHNKLGMTRAGTSPAGPVVPINVGLIVPHSAFMRRTYMQKIVTSFEKLGAMRFFQFTAQEVTMRMLNANPSPLGKIYFNNEQYLFLYSLLFHVLILRVPVQDI